MDLLPAEVCDDLLPELPQANAGPGKLRVGGNHAEDVPRGRIAVEAEKKIGCAQVKEAQGVRLDDLAQIHQAPKLLRGRRYADRQDLVRGLGRRQEVADRADAAHTRGNPRHFVQRAALAEPLEAAKLGDVELGVGHLSAVVEVDGDLGVPFDPRDWVNDNPLSHKGSVPFQVVVGATHSGWGVA